MGWVCKNTALRNQTGYFYNGKEIALCRERGGSDKKRFRGKVQHYPEKVKIEAATLWAVTRDIKRVAEIMDIYPSVIRLWMKEPWWDNIISQVRKEKNEELDSKLSEVIHKTVEVIKDRVENGEVQVDRRTKEEFRVPLNTQAATRVLEVTFKERQLLRGEATTNVQSTSTDKKLEQLAEQFKTIANHRKTETLEAEYVDVSETGEGSETQTDPQNWGEEPQEGQTSEGSGSQVNGVQTESETETEEVRFTL